MRTKDFDVVPQEIPNHIAKLRKEMRQAAKELAFERAAQLRDEIKELEIYALRFA